MKKRTVNILETWEKISGFDGYEVSSLGRVRSFRKAANDYTAPDHFVIIKGEISNSGYMRVCIVGNDHKYHHQSIHRLVATYFVANPNGESYVNHKDENRLNNQASNLEWCSMSYNTRYGTAIRRANETKSKNNVFEKIRLTKEQKGTFEKAREQFGRKVNQINPYTNQIIKTWPSLKNIQDTLGINRKSIAGYANHQRQKEIFHGYKWSWHIEEGEEIISTRK